MPQQQAVSVEKSFINGLVTEATALNFPENACVDTLDCEFDLDGSVYRRNGFDFELNYTTKTINRADSVVNTYLWQNVAGNGNTSILVMQVGSTLYFYETTGSGTFSLGAVSSTVTLTPVSGAPATNTVEAQFCDGNGFLIVTHPYCQPIRISYDLTTSTATPTSLTLYIRDFEGDVTDPYAVDFRPTATFGGLDVHHLYNLYNQGWTSPGLTGWDTGNTTMPSNSDIMWRFKDSSDNLDFTAASIARITSGNTPASRGHQILVLANQDRNNVVTGAVSTTTGFQRPSACAFFAGRVFYGGINSTGFNSKIYFTQILENSNQYSYCYQVNDPTSEDLFDILPSDGGVISIPEAGTIYKMFTVPGGLGVFAANGVWFITGSTGIGFTATDYAVLKVADINSVSATSFVNVSGLPCWWNSEGIYILASSGNSNIPSVQSLTYDTFKTFYDDIPLASKRFARGFYNKTDNVLRWVYRSTGTGQQTATYEFDRVLNYNLRTKAFYPWTISASAAKVNGIVSSELITQPVTTVNVIDSLGNFVIDSHGNQVISFSASGSDEPQFDKFVVSYPDSGSYKFTFADRKGGEYIDWKAYDSVGSNYTSYIITGYKLDGQALRKFQSNYVVVYSRLTDQPVSYNFQGIWDFANTGSGTGRWSANQQVLHDDLSYDNATKRLKVRGHGKALQFRVSSVDDLPFDILGWASFKTINGAA